MSAANDPSPEEIAERCLLIQAGWTAREKLSRIRSDWRPSFTTCDGRELEMDAETYSGHHEQREALQAISTTTPNPHQRGEGVKMLET